MHLYVVILQYVPVRGETVIGVVTKKGIDEILLDIGSSEPGVVDLLSFEGATKKNKPAIKVLFILIYITYHKY